MRAYVFERFLQPSAVQIYFAPHARQFRRSRVVNLARRKQFFVDSADCLKSVGGRFSTVRHKVGANSFSGAIAERAKSAWLQSRVISSIEIGSSVAFLIRKTATVFEGSAKPLNDHETCFSALSETVSATAFKFVSSSNRSSKERDFSNALRPSAFARGG
jgi:hypothetical protein